MSWWILLNVQTAVFYAALAAFVYLRRPPPPLWPSLFFTIICMALWSVGELGTAYAPTLAWKQASIAILYTGSLFLAPATWVTAFRFAEAHGRPFGWARPALIRAPVWVAIAFWFALITNPWHGAFLTPVVGHRNEHHWLWTLSVAVGFGELAVVLGLCAAFLVRVRASRHLRTQAAIILTALGLPLVTTTAQSLTGPWPWPIDLSLVAGWITSVLLVVGIYRTRLFNLSPVALSEMMGGDPSGVLLIDEDGMLLLANPSAKRIFGELRLTPEVDLARVLAPLLRRPVRDARPFDEEQLRRELLAPDSAGELYQLDGEPSRWLWVTSTPIPLRRRATSARSIRVQDVTSLYRLERSRRELEARIERDERLRSLGILAGGIAHEINNPVGSILATAQLAQSSLGSESEDEAIADALDTIAHEARRCGEIVKGVLRFARGETSERWPGNLNDAILQAQNGALRLLEEERATLELELAEQLPPVSFNPTAIEQMFDNLIRNSLQAGAKHITIRSEARQGEVSLRVGDDGRGVAPQQRTRAFEPFYTARRSEGGTGLGLSVVHGIVGSHGGKIELESEPGGGTRVVVTLPAAGSG